jgi:tetratricopeptide (TPR) repeat protein
MAQISFSQQTKTQLGYVKELNSGEKKRGKNIGGVQILFEDAKATTSDDVGGFELVFLDKGDGDIVFLERIYKEGYELVNIDDFEPLVLSSSDSLIKPIVLAKAGTIAKNVQVYLRKSDSVVASEFKRKLKFLRNQLAKEKISNQSFNQQLTALKEERNLIKSKLLALAEKFARIDFDDQDPVYNEALLLYQQGKIKAAIEKLNSIDLLGRTKSILLEENRIKEGKKELSKQEQALGVEKKKQIKYLLTLTDFYSVDFNSKKAISAFDQLLLLDSTDVRILSEAGNFYAGQYLLEKSKSCFEKIIQNDANSSFEILTANYDLGEVYKYFGKYEQAIPYYENANVIAERMILKDSSEYLMNNLSGIKLMLAQSHAFSVRKDLEKAQKYGFEGLNLLLKLKKSGMNDLTYETNLVNAYTIVGNISALWQNTLGAYKYHSKALNYALESYENHPTDIKVRHDLSLAYEQVGDGELALKNYQAALDYYSKAVELTEGLLKEFPNLTIVNDQAYIIYSKLADAYGKLGKFDKSLEFQLVSLELAKKLHQEYPENLEFEQWNMKYHGFVADWYLYLDDQKNAEIYFKKYTNLMKAFLKRDPENPIVKRESVLYLGNYAKYLSSIKNYKAATEPLRNYLRGLISLEKEEGQTPESLIKIAKAHKMLAENFFKIKKPKESRDQYQKAYRIWNYLLGGIKNDPIILYNLHLISKELGFNYKAELLFEESRKQFYTSLNYIKRLFDSDKKYKSEYLQALEKMAFAEVLLERYDQAKVYYDTMNEVEGEVPLNDLISLGNHSLKESNDYVKYKASKALFFMVYSKKETTPKQLAAYYSNYIFQSLLAGQFKEAETSLAKAMKLDPTNAELIAYQPLILLLNGRETDAVNLYRKMKSKPYKVIKGTSFSYEDLFHENLGQIIKRNLVTEALRPSVERVLKLLDEK